MEKEIETVYHITKGGEEYDKGSASTRRVPGELVEAVSEKGHQGQDPE
jgi:hypothetical protein